jgi:tRNA nucleotidyltransferase (CCA-adding enzyme)
MNLPKAVEYVIKKVNDMGGQAYLVGGALRDHLLGRPVFDYDIAVSLLPDEVTDLFSNHRSWPTGKRFGTVTVEVDKIKMEITTFRQEALYSDSRHPDKVSFVSDINLDLSRRDFTINAMAWNPLKSSALIDPFQGKEDLNKRIIRTVGSPYERFSEDPLRIMRGVRFSAQLNFEIHEDTRKAMITCSEALRKVSAERINVELNKLLLSLYPQKGLLELQATGALTILFSPENTIEEKPLTTLNQQSWQLIKHLPKHLPLRLAALMCLLYEHHLDFNSPEGAKYIKNLLNRLRYDNQTIAHVIKLMQAYKNFQSMEVSPYTVRKLIGQVGIDDTRNILYWASTKDKGNQNDLNDKLEHAISILSSVQQNNTPVFFEQLAIKGDDILKVGIGKKNPRLVGEALNVAYDWVLRNPEWNHIDYLIDKLREYYSSEIS